MPPKGWRKNGEGVPTTKESELVSIEDILFPKSTIQKLAKDILTPDTPGDNMILAKDSLLAVQRSATVFVSHLMFHARQVAKDAERKNVNAQDILVALERADLAGFVPEVKQKLSTFEYRQDTKKKSRNEEKAGADSEEPVAKKLRDNDSRTVPQGDDTLDAEDEDEEIEDEDDGDATKASLDDTEEVEEDNEEEVVAENPIAAMNKELTELEGTQPEEQEEDDDQVETEDE